MNKDLARKIEIIKKSIGVNLTENEAKEEIENLINRYNKIVKSAKNS